MSYHSSPITSSSSPSSQKRTHRTSNSSTSIGSPATSAFVDYSKLGPLSYQPGDSPPYVSPYAPISENSSLSATSSARNPLTKSPSLAVSDPFEESTKNLSLLDNQYSSITADMNAGKIISSKEKATLLQSLKTHRVNTLIELRRIERVLAPLNTPDVTDAMTSAWAHYVNSNNLLSELRSLTKSYPFSSECIDEAKWMVISDAASMKSWNYCWLVLQKAKNQNLIPKHARQLAQKLAMWGGRTPTAKGVEQLAKACVAEWTQALNQLLRHWDAPPVIGGRA